MSNDIRQIPTESLRKSGVHDGIEYHEFECLECGKTDKNTYSEPYRTNMRERLLCWTCNYYFDLAAKMEKDHAKMTIIGGHVYAPGNQTSGAFLGMAGRRFDIEYVSPSLYAGQKITTFDLWSGSSLPDKLRSRFSDTAFFLGGAEKADAGGITCWDSSDSRGAPYPPPSSLKAAP